MEDESVFSNRPAFLNLCFFVCFFFRSRRGRAEDPGPQLSSVLSISVGVGAAGRTVVLSAHQPHRVSAGWHRGSGRTHPDPVLSRHLWSPHPAGEREHLRPFWWVTSMTGVSAGFCASLCQSKLFSNRTEEVLMLTSSKTNSNTVSFEFDRNNNSVFKHSLICSLWNSLIPGTVSLLRLFWWMIESPSLLVSGGKRSSTTTQ